VMSWIFRSSNDRGNMVILPDDIWLTIFNLLSAKQVTKLSTVCKRWNILAKDDRFWKEICKRYGIHSIPKDENTKSNSNWKSAYISTKIQAEKSMIDFNYVSYDGCNHRIKIIILGNAGVGKTTLQQAYLEGRYNVTHPITNLSIEFGTKIVEIGGKKIKLQIWDTFGQERFRIIARSYYRGAIGALLCFDLSNRNTFEEISNWIDEIRKNNPFCFIILVGTKLDLPRQVTEKEAQKMADNLELPYFETSSKQMIAVEEPFYCVVDAIIPIIRRMESELRDEFPTKSSSRCY